jgi:nitroimidazol reductase NimA-like FMN-containing flavoprotein (pyridoxamine 5'-phosphate oxidase superfamily)
MFGKLTTNEVERLIHDQFIGRVGCHADNTTYVVPISYAYDGDYIYGHTLEGMKVNMMRKNPKICFEVDSTSNLSNWQSVIAWGEFEELGAGLERNEALRKLEERKLPILRSETMQLSSQWPFPSDVSEIGGIVFRIKLGEKTGRFERNEDRYFYAT